MNTQENNFTLDLIKRAYSNKMIKDDLFNLENDIDKIITSLDEITLSSNIGRTEFLEFEGIFYDYIELLKEKYFNYGNLISCDDC